MTNYQSERKREVLRDGDGNMEPGEGKWIQMLGGGDVGRIGDGGSKGVEGV